MKVPAGGKNGGQGALTWGQSVLRTGVRGLRRSALLRSEHFQLSMIAKGQKT